MPIAVVVCYRDAGLDLANGESNIVLSIWVHVRDVGVTYCMYVNSEP